MLCTSQYTNCSSRQTSEWLTCGLACRFMERVGYGDAHKLLVLVSIFAQKSQVWKEFKEISLKSNGLWIRNRLTYTWINKWKPCSYFVHVGLSTFCCESDVCLAVVRKKDERNFQLQIPFHWNWNGLQGYSHPNGNLFWQKLSLLFDIVRTKWLNFSFEMISILFDYCMYPLYFDIAKSNCKNNKN